MRKSEKEALQAMLDDEQETIKALEKAYQRAIRRIDNHIRILESDEMTQSKIYQKRYQEAMKAQINAALDELHKKSNQTIEEYLTRSYQHGYVGTMYTLHKQGMPILAPIDQRAVTRAVRTDSKLSGRLYGELGVDMQKLKKTIRREISIGISIGSDYNMIARQVQISSGIPLKRAKTIVRTEGHRIQQQSADDARNAAKAQGCQVVKQWDAVLDGNTRTDHRILDGQIREVGEPFEIDGKKAEYPGAFGRPEEDCNCRCVALTRAKWALDADELQTMKERAKFFGLDKTENFREFEEKYLKSAENVQTGGNIYDYLKRYEKRNEQATAAYKKIAADDDIEAIAKTSGMSTANIKQIKQHVFFETHQLYDGVGKFEPDYDMAVAWQRLTEGHPEERDILLLRHELLESQLEKAYNLSAADAHRLASKTYDWAAELLKLLGEDGEADDLLQNQGEV